MAEVKLERQEHAEDTCRAEIPALLPPETQRQLQRSFEPRYGQRWGQRDVLDPRFPTLDDVTVFLRKFSRLHMTETALQCLFEAKYDVPRAVELLRSAQELKLADERSLTQRLPQDAFEHAVATHNKKFHLVKESLGENVSPREVVSAFYLWKRTPAFAQWHNYYKFKKSGSRHAGGDEDDAEDVPPDFHNTHCEVCCTGGRLLCCDGCERAYHLSCVLPPVTQVPHDHWYCPPCHDILGRVPATVASAENPFCRVTAPREVLEDSRSSGSSHDILDEQWGHGEGEDPTGSEDSDDGSDSASTLKWSPATGYTAGVSDPDESKSDAKTDGESEQMWKKQRRAEPKGSGDRLLPSLAQLHVTPNLAPRDRKRQRKSVAPRRIPQKPNE